MMSTMRFTKSIELPGPIVEVREMLLDADFREEVARRAGAVEVEVTVDRDGERTVARIETRQPTTGMPAIATKFLGDQLAVRQEERWHSPDGGDLEITIPGQPGRVDGTVRLAERAGVTVQTVEADIAVRIPLIGGKVEKLIGSVVGQVLQLQAQVGAERLGSP